LIYFIFTIYCVGPVSACSQLSSHPSQLQNFGYVHFRILESDFFDLQIIYCSCPVSPSVWSTNAFLLFHTLSNNYWISVNWSKPQSFVNNIWISVNWSKPQSFVNNIWFSVDWSKPQSFVNRKKRFNNSSSAGIALNYLNVCSDLSKSIVIANLSVHHIFSSCCMQPVHGCLNRLLYLYSSKLNA